MMVTAPLSAQPAKQFDFAGLRTTVVVRGSVTIGDTTCAFKGAGVEWCDTGVQIGTSYLGQTHVLFHNGHLTSLRGLSLGANYDKILEAFTAKYGRPTDVKHLNKLGYGAPIPYSVNSWRFQDGTLVLDEMMGGLNGLGVTFASNHDLPPVEKQTVNF